MHQESFVSAQGDSLGRIQFAEMCLQRLALIRRIVGDEIAAAIWIQEEWTIASGDGHREGWMRVDDARFRRRPQFFRTDGDCPCLRCWRLPFLEQAFLSERDRP